MCGNCRFSSGVPNMLYRDKVPFGGGVPVNCAGRLANRCGNFGCCARRTFMRFTFGVKVFRGFFRGVNCTDWSMLTVLTLVVLFSGDIF